MSCNCWGDGWIGVDLSVVGETLGECPVTSKDKVEPPTAQSWGTSFNVLKYKNTNTNTNEKF